MTDKRQLSKDLQDLSDMEAAGMVRHAMRTSGHMLSMVDTLAVKMVEMVVELAEKKLKERLDNDAEECTIE